MALGSLRVVFRYQAQPLALKVVAHQLPLGVVAEQRVEGDAMPQAV